uniref:RING-type domain-containing protein n=1 Tax=Peronospora matthiolae TaxID=2874970 RepID=A0AAV1U246_9STRA
MALRVRRWSDIEPRRRPRHQAVYATCTPRLAPAASAASDAQPRAASSQNVPLAVLEDAPECVICLDELVLGRALFTAECGHRFHFSCLLENVNHDEANSDKCPICRKPQTQWPEQTEGLVKAHPYCTNCGKRGSGGQFCDGCGQSLAHTPTAQERARAAAAAAAARSNVVVECPTCRIRCLVNTTARGTLQCPNGHLFQLRLPPTMGNSHGARQSFTGGAASLTSGPRPIMRQCPTCYTRVQMPPGSQAGQYMCPHGHTFYFSPFQ